MANDTIVAGITAPGDSAVAVTRVSGPRALELVAARFRGRRSPLSSPSHRILFGSFLGDDGAPVDTVLLSVFRAPHTYTGEDVAEISSHGGAAIPRAIFDALVADGARPARPGEFTERAYRNGKLDLAQAESVAALVRARSERSARAASLALGGALSRRVEAWDGALIAVLAEVVSRIDFPAEVFEDVDGEALAESCETTIREIDELLARLPGSRRVQEGIRVSMVGRPNVGKSSLLNSLLGYDRAIVTEHPGTTRDTLEDSIWLDGVELRLTDTAGVRAVDDPVERLGVERAEGAVRACDLAVVVLDRSLPETESASHASELMTLASGRPVIVAWNKADLKRGSEARGAVLDAMAEVETVAIHAGGAEPLRDALRSAIPFMLGAHAGEEIATTSARQEGLLAEARGALERASSGLREERSYDLVAVDLEDARRALAEVRGRGVDDQVVAAIFSRFCIGK
ncbi:MAG TPA: tRNA uridine-5-carboxymethylaminomethyl(34) synthesis GTPase MnmE [Candidatus Eisenbacteria bacterium]|nr:tRNA uridine-5-carboxymethylaminomethyl(34) synthesis GTPase MnmE [Candidatus Eisenbacteria bacterium]